MTARHDQGYFRTTQWSFLLQPRQDGGTRLTIRSHHVMDLEPALYWAPLAQWAISSNTGRVLAHLKRQAEGGAQPSALR